MKEPGELDGKKILIEAFQAALDNVRTFKRNPFSVTVSRTFMHSCACQLSGMGKTYIVFLFFEHNI